MIPSAALSPTHSESVAADVCPTTVAAVDATADAVAPHFARCCWYCCCQLNDAHSLEIDRWNLHVCDASNYHVVVVVVTRFDVAERGAAGRRENLAAPTAV